MPWRHLATFKCFRRKLMPEGSVWNSTSAWQPWQSVCQLLDPSHFLPCLYKTEHWAIIFFGEAAEGFISRESLNAAALKVPNQCEGQGGWRGLLVWRVSLILLTGRRWCLCREMRYMAAVAQPGMDTWRGHGEVVSCSSGMIKALFHTWHLRNCRLLTPRTFPCVLLWNATFWPGSWGPEGMKITVWQCVKGQTRP